MPPANKDNGTNGKHLPSRAFFYTLAIFAVLLGGALLWHSSSKPPQMAAPAKPPEQIVTKERHSREQLMPFAVDHDPNDKTLEYMRGQAISLAKAMDNSRHPCNPLVTAKTKITGVAIKPLTKGDKIYTMWLSDGVTTCGLDDLHSEGKHPELLQGDFLRRFYLQDLEGGFAYNQQLMQQALSPDNKRFSKVDIGEVAHDMLLEACGDSFFQNTLPQQYNGFSVSDGYNLTENSPQSDGSSHYTKNVVRASLRRTDMPQANAFDMTVQSKVDVYIQAEPSDSSLSFKVVYVDVNNNGFDTTKYGRTGNVSGQASTPPTAKRLR
ncbi:MAG: hypothetical protein WCT12_28125 [Verrucomicrobiota bacterium]|jgi:hypothetical protein